jgi:hypothetical protein
MIRFGVAISTSSGGAEAAREAAAIARQRLGDARVAMALVFASASYDDVGAVPRPVEPELGSAPLLGGTSPPSPDPPRLRLRRDRARTP